MARLKELGSVGALQQKMLSKSTDIVLQIGKEIDGLAHIFHENKVRQLQGDALTSFIRATWMLINQRDSSSWNETFAGKTRSQRVSVGISTVGLE